MSPITHSNKIKYNVFQSDFLWQIGTCFLIKGGKNSNKADAQGESWVEMLSVEKPCLSKLWISWGPRCLC